MTCAARSDAKKDDRAGDVCAEAFSRVDRRLERCRCLGSSVSPAPCRCHPTRRHGVDADSRRQLDRERFGPADEGAFARGIVRMAGLPRCAAVDTTLTIEATDCAAATAATTGQHEDGIDVSRSLLPRSERHRVDRTIGPDASVVERMSSGHKTERTPARRLGSAEIAKIGWGSKRAAERLDGGDDALGGGSRVAVVHDQIGSSPRQSFGGRRPYAAQAPVTNAAGPRDRSITPPARSLERLLRTSKESRLSPRDPPRETETVAVEKELPALPMPRTAPPRGGLQYWLFGGGTLDTPLSHDQRPPVVPGALAHGRRLLLDPRLPTRHRSAPRAASSRRSRLYILIAVTALGSAPVYAQVARRSFAGQGSIAMLENLIPGWAGKVFVLSCSASHPTDSSSRDALGRRRAQHAVEKYIPAPYIGDARLPVPLVLLALLAAVS